jgi:hypothetical protein
MGEADPKDTLCDVGVLMILVGVIPVPQGFHRVGCIDKVPGTTYLCRRTGSLERKASLPRTRDSK